MYRTAPLLLTLLFCGSLAADVIDGEELVDPTRPLFAGAVVESDDTGLPDRTRNILPANFDVTFVRASSSSPIAIVNDQRVTVGDTIGGAQVTGIDRNGVTLSVNGQERRITLFGSGVKTPVNAR